MRFLGLLLAKSGRLGSSHRDWFSFWGPRQLLVPITSVLSGDHSSIGAQRGGVFQSLPYTILLFDMSRSVSDCDLVPALAS